MAGETTAAEIAEQPAVLERLKRDAAPAAAEIATVLRARAPRFVLFVARGTSGQAALYGKYLVEIQHSLPCGMVSPSTFTTYHSRPDLRDVLVIAVSQSGGSPDLVRTIEVARTLGASTLAVTNTADSDLARASELQLDVIAGAEKSVTATKSYSAELLGLWLVVQAWRGAGTGPAAGLPDAVAGHLARHPEVAAIADRYRFADRMVITGRGFSYPTAGEAAMKLMETCYLPAQAFTGSDLLHGPVAMIGRDHPAIAIVPNGAAGRAMTPVLARLATNNADLLLLRGDECAHVGTVSYRLPTLREDLSPIADIVPLQLLALEMALSRGNDPDAPRGLAKVTRTH